jgi:L-threonylcarbamoyladenylate synthase
MRPYVGELSDLETRLAGAFMPGPLTMILPHLTGICASARAGGDTVAVRVPEHPLAREILAYLEVPIAAPSANPSGRPSATTAAMARGYFPQIDHVWDGGDCGYGLESTVVRVTGNTVRILRPGYIGREDIERILLPHECAVYGSAEAGESTVPGAKYRHYAPKAHIRLLDSSSDTGWIEHDGASKTALIASEEYCRAHADLLAMRPGMGVEIW